MEVANEVVAAERLLFTMRGHRVLLDSDLARIYGVSTKRFNQAVKRNLARFPADFAFRLTAAEFAELRARQAIDSESGPKNWSRTVTSSGAEWHTCLGFSPSTVH